MNTNEELIELLKKDGYLKNPVIIEAFKNVDRKDFVPDSEKEKSYTNEALLIGFEQTISQPLVVAFMLELLDLKIGERVLEVGTGSGWKTALMAYILTHMKREIEQKVEFSGNEDKTHKEIIAQNELTSISYSVISIERIEELQKFAKENLAKYEFEKQGIVRLVLGDGSLGCKEFEPYDKIIAAAATDEIPVAWLDQLKIGGKIIAPIKNSIVVVEKRSKDAYDKKEYFGFSFVPLIKD
ncbi:MAG: protein-L-isoaspartate O-methyltransferase family protein [Minisyncoccota bacterium]